MTVFSIVTVTRNNRAGLRRTYESLQSQHYRDFEWIVIDGASTDGTPDDLRATGAQWVSEPDNGIYDAMNKGIARAAGDYLLFLNAGDRLADPAVLAAIAALPPHGLIYGDGREGSFLKPARRHAPLRWGMPTYHQAVFYRREHIGDLRYDTAYPVAADYKFTAEFTHRCRDIHYWPHAVCIFEPGGLSQVRAAQGRRETAQIRRALRLCPPVVNEMVMGAQTVLWALRRYCPRLYERARGRRR